MISEASPAQPMEKDWKFVEELSKPATWHFNWTRNIMRNKEAHLCHGVKIRNEFSAPANCLETAFTDLDNFFNAAGISLKGKYEIIIEQAVTDCFEAYQLDIKPEYCRIQAGDTEGVRRAIYYLEDLLLGADGPFLPLGVIKRKPWLKSRISRCFFGPIKRPPLNRDELMDDVDYYPDEYLNRLAHEGINGLWLTIAFRDLCKTSISKLDPDAEKRLAKLRRTVDKCLRYGIKTYIFCIEPRAMAPDNPVLLNNPDLKGPITWDNKSHCFCPFSDVAQKYLYDSTNWIFSQVPRLGGMINISFGERDTTCTSSSFGSECPVCSKKTPGQIIAAALKPMERGIHAAAPDAELISWLYVPQNGTGDQKDRTREMLDIADKIPENVILQYNFESGGSKEQLGKKRHAGDYWLSYTGPSEKYKSIIKKAQGSGRQVSAKIQVTCSHEVATVPLVPVPGLLYRKYKAMYELKVSHVMQCWYFGSYPGIMNKAAGELAFEEFKDTEEDFLHRLAKPQWGKYSGKVLTAWNLLSEGYEHYPLDNMFQYYGPVHDGVVWPLYLKPADKPLAPTWKLEFGTSGDRYGECLGTFSLDEVLTLCGKLSAKWNKGVKIFSKLQNCLKDSEDCLKDINLVKALNIQFSSACNILKFYALRNDLIKESNKTTLTYMREIVLDEIKNSEKMLELCKTDSRLGFHPEAEGYKYFPEKLIWRVKLLNSLLQDDFPHVWQRLNAGLKAFPARRTKSYECNSGKYEYTENFAWKADYKNGTLKISIDNFTNKVNGQFRVFVEPKPFSPPLCVTGNGENDIEIPLLTDNKEAGFNIFKVNTVDSNNVYSGWEKFSPLAHRLVLGDYNPLAKGRLILKNTKKQEEGSSLKRKKKEETVQI